MTHYSTGSTDGRTRRLVVAGVDGSPSSRHALQWALDEGVRLDADVEAVTAWHGLTPGWYPDHVVPEGHEATTVELEARQALDDTCNVLQLARPIAVHPLRRVVLEGDPAAVLLARAEHAELLVLGRRGHRPAGPHLGSVVDGCTRRAPCPVAVVPLSDRAGTARVVVGVDGSPGSRVALDWAGREARRRQARLEVVLAVVPSHARDTGRAQHALNTLVDEVLSEQAGNVIRRVCIDHAVPALLDAAARADVVVVGSRGLGAVRSLVLGSVSNAVVRSAPCTTVVVPDVACDGQL